MSSDRRAHDRLLSRGCLRARPTTASGSAQVLARRGHRVVFIVEESFAGTLEAKGFEERLMRLGPPPEEPEVPGQFWIDFIRDTAPVFRKPTSSSSASSSRRPGRRSSMGRSTSTRGSTEIIDEVAPDVDRRGQRRRLPGVWRAGRPWVRIVSCNPAEMKDPRVPPFSSGYPAGDRSGVAGVPRRGATGRTRDMWADFDAFCREHGDDGPGLRPSSAPTSSPSRRGSTCTRTRPRPTTRERPLGPTWHRLDSTVRAADATWELPAHLARAATARSSTSRSGSLGSADVGLMQRLVDLLGRTRHRVIVSKGPLADQITLHDNLTGEGFLPQPAILPQVDLVITHGGNNTVTEAFHHGKPMIVLPLFWDQVDNAQRVDETGFGRRLADLRLRDEELTGAIDALLRIGALAARLADEGRRRCHGSRRPAPFVRPTLSSVARR